MSTKYIIAKFGLRLAAVFVMGIFVFVTPSLWGQATSAILGKVTDASGAAVPAANVTIRNTETGVVRMVVTNDAGDYQVLSLPVGQYEVRVEKSGFKAVVRSGINLVVAQEAVVNAQLEVGQVTQAVTVTGEAELVNTTPSSTSGLVAEQQVKDLPLNGRSFDTLITLNPNTANTTSYRSSTSTGGGQGYNFVVSGNREDFNLFTLNGIEYTGVSTADVSPGGVSGQLLGVDAVREFNVLENTYGAEYGKRPGGQVSVVTQSGSNSFHGSIFEFLRNSAFDAHNFFDQPGTPKPQFQRNQFGAAAGGPIIKDKTFIFGNYEGFRQHLGLSGNGVVPDLSTRSGFLPCAFVSPKPNPCPASGLVSVGPAAGVAPYFGLWPVPNGPEIITSSGGLTGTATLFSHPLQTIREDFGNLRLDQTLSGADTFAGIYTVDDGVSLTPDFRNPLQQTLSDLRSQVVSLQETHVFSSAAVNTARVGFSRARWLLNSAPSFIPPGVVPLVPGRPVGSISIGSTGVSGVGSVASAGSVGAQQFEKIARNLFTATDDFQLTRGAHLLSIGVWFQRVQSNDDAANQRNSVAQFTDLQHFLQGQSSNMVAVLNPTEVPWRQFAGAWYVQDAIKVRNNVTLSVGLRHEFNNGWNSPQGEASNFVFGPNGALLTQPVVSTHTYSTNNARLLFGPRLGLAYAPFRATAIHLGYGTYFNQMDYLGSCCDGSPIGTFNQGVSLGSASAPATFPLVLTPNLPGSKVAPAGVDPNLKMTTVEEWSAKVEQGITSTTEISVAYIGEKGFHLPNTVDVNTVIPSPTANGFPGTPFATGSPVRANPGLSNARYTLSNADSSYNALQVDVTRRFGAGLRFRGAYAFAKSLDDHSSSFLANEGIAGATTIMIPQNPRADWGPSNFDVTHQFVGNFNYDLPFGKGKYFGRNASGVADKFFSGWQWNGIATVQTGFPFTPLVSFNRSNNGDSRAPDRVSLNPNFTGPLVLGTPTQWFNPLAFVLPAPGTYGNGGRDILRGPRLGEFDTSFFKTTTLTEAIKLQFRAEFFNILNRPNFGMPTVGMFTSSGSPAGAGVLGVPAGAPAIPGSATTPVSGTAGQINMTSTTQREIQFGLKLLW
jgi:Carboxypeptidase regulatory-like domain